MECAEGWVRHRNSNSNKKEKDGCFKALEKEMTQVLKTHSSN